MFKKGRMAYVVEMEEENQTEVPTTLLRLVEFLFTFLCLFVFNFFTLQVTYRLS